MTETSERRNIYLERKERGLCPRWGAKKAKSVTYIFCDDCRAFYRNYQNENSEIYAQKRRAKYAERKRKGLCPRCGIKLAKKNKNKTCPDCLEKQYNYGKLGRKRKK